jgi:catechol 2,3-dioxygenase-like lactoylglutathione lyase family enzyme
MNKESIALRVQHIGLWVRDLIRSGRFYGHVLGFEKQDSYYVPAKLMHHIFGQDTACTVEVYRRDGVALELFQSDQKMQDQGPYPLIPGINHFGLEVPDKRAFCQDAKEKGAQVIEVVRGDHLVYFIRDPDGILIEIKER